MCRTPTPQKTRNIATPEDQFPVQVNDDAEPFEIKTEHFHGRIAVRMKESRIEGQGPSRLDTTTAYFARHPGWTWSIEFQCRFLSSDVGCDDLVFGNIFDRPLRPILPWGTNAVLKFVHLIVRARSQFFAL